MMLVVVIAPIDILGLLALGVWKSLLCYGILLTCVGVFLVFDGTYLLVCAYWCVLFFHAMYCIFMQGKVTAFACW